MKETGVSKTVDLGAHRGELAKLAEAHKKVAEIKENLKQWEAYLDTLKAGIVARLGDAEAGVLDGREVVTYKAKKQFRHAQFTKDHPDLAAMFTRKQVVETLDWEVLLKAEPQLAGGYVTKVFSYAG